MPHFVERWIKFLSLHWLLDLFKRRRISQVIPEKESNNTQANVARGSPRPGEETSKQGLNQPSQTSDSPQPKDPPAVAKPPSMKQETGLHDHRSLDSDQGTQYDGVAKLCANSVHNDSQKLVAEDSDEQSKHPNGGSMKPIERVDSFVPSNAPTEVDSSCQIRNKNLWDQAYRQAEENEETAKLVKAYEKVLSEMPGNGPKNADPTTTHWQEIGRLVKSDLQKTESLDVARKLVGGLAFIVNKVKSLGDVAVQANPIAALAWAGVSMVLGVRRLSSLSNQ